MEPRLVLTMSYPAISKLSLWGRAKEPTYVYEKLMISNLPTVIKTLTKRISP